MPSVLSLSVSLLLLLAWTEPALAAGGAELRLDALLRDARPEQRQALAGGLARLLDPAQMGTLFKALALVSPGLPAPDGFAAEPR